MNWKPARQMPWMASLLIPLFLCPPLALAAAVTNPPAETVPTWHAQTLAQALAYMLIFAAIGIAVAIVGYKLFDKATPGDLSKEILENKNIAAAIVAAAVILGVCIIIAASMLG